MHLPKFHALKLAALGAALACTPFAANAEAGRVDVNVAIDLRGVDLSTPAGAKVASARIKAATYAFCGHRPSSMLIAATKRYEACRREFIQRAVTTIDAPMVTMAQQQTRG